MKKNLLQQGTLALCLSIATTAGAQSITKYEMTIKNGSQMPVSPGVFYSKTGSESAVAIGSAPTTGFVQLCQTGNVSVRLNELKLNSAVKFVNQTIDPILPGESRVVEIEVQNAQEQSIHFEAMYGKSKDACSVGSIGSHSLIALRQHVTSEVIQKDNVLLTGAFTEPAVPTGMTYLDPSICATTMNAVSCLRELSVANTAKKQVRFFAGYSPSLIMALETKFGASDTQTLNIPTSGAIQLSLKLKH